MTSVSSTNFLTSLGAGSGIDTKTLAQNLADAEVTPKKDLISGRITKTEAKISAYGYIKTALYDLQTAFGNLNDASDFTSIKPTVSQPTAFGVSTSSSAADGSYSLEVSRIATAQRSASNTFGTRDGALNGGNAFYLSLTVGNGAPSSISVTNNTPAGMVSAINGAKLGVTAQLINTGSGYKVMLTGAEGAQQGFSMTAQGVVSNNFDASNTSLNDGQSFDLSLTIGNGSPSSITVSDDTPAGMVDAINNAGAGVKAQLINTGSGCKVMLTTTDGSSQSIAMTSDQGLLSFSNNISNASAVSFSTKLQDAADARFTINGLEMTRSSNAVSDVIDGVTLNLFTATNGAARLDLNRDTTAIKSNITALVTAYNNFDTTIKELGNSKSTIEDVGGSMAGDNFLQSIRNKVRALISTTASTPGSNIKAARDMGISFDRNGQMTLDNAKFDTALQSHFDQVVKVFSAGTNNKSIYSPAPAGIAGDAFRTLDGMLRSTGQLNVLTDNASKQVTSYQADLKKLDEQMQKLMDNYIQQFSVMDSIVGNSNSLRSSLKSTFASMSGNNGN